MTDGAGMRQVPEAELRLKKLYNVRIPFPQPRPGKSTKYSLAYGTPTDITVVGSYSRQTAIRAGEALSIDLAVTMPAVCCPDFSKPMCCLTLGASQCSRIKITSTIDTSTREPTT